jgi:hypothetical protein
MLAAAVGRRLIWINRNATGNMQRQPLYIGFPSQSLLKVPADSP